MAQTLINNLSYSTLDATKLSGNLPSISGASLTGLSNDFKLIQSQSSTSASSLSFTTGFDGTYDSMMFVVNDLDVSDDGVDFYARVFHGSGASTEGTGGYVYSVFGYDITDTTQCSVSSSTSKMMLFAGVDSYATYKHGLTLMLGKPDATGLKRMWFHGAFERNSSGNNTSVFGGCTYADSSNAITGIKFYPSAGTFATVTINQYGLKGS